MDSDRPVILIVDDAVENITALAAVLRDSYDVRFATHGEQALQQASIHPLPTLVLLDVVMPGIDGYEVCRRLKEAEETRDIPVIFVSARDDEVDEATGFTAGAVDYITKPFRAPIVRARVRTHVELKLQTDAFARVAALDGLTGIPNRRRFDESLDAEWRRGTRSGQPVALMLIDADSFKAYNDFYGHLAGDSCLVAIAGCLKQTFLRAGEVVARYGGEEFVVLLPGCELAQALAAAKRLQGAVAALAIPHLKSDVAEVVTLSIGVASLRPEVGSPALHLVEAADRELYRAKDAGRNRVEPAG